MQPNDDFDPAYHLPLVLDEQDDINLYDGAVTWPRVFKASIVIAIATAAGIAALSVRDPVALVADVTAALGGSSQPRADTGQPTPAIQTAAEAPAPIQTVANVQAAPPAATDAPTSGQIAASDPTENDQTEKSEPPHEALFKQFQAWATEQDTQVHVSPAQPVQDAPANLNIMQDPPTQAAESARAPQRIAQKHRVRPVHDARAEIRAQNPRPRVARVQNARAERPPVQDARVQEVPAPPAQSPSFLPSFGQRN